MDELHEHVGDDIAMTSPPLTFEPPRTFLGAGEKDMALAVLGKLLACHVSNTGLIKCRILSASRADIKSLHKIHYFK